MTRAEFLATTTKYNTNGVKSRQDGKGDGWAFWHREGEKMRGIYMIDCDGLFGNLAFATRTADKLFFEYEPDNNWNKREAVREFAYIGAFDRKSTLKHAMSDENLLCKQVYMDMVRKLSHDQPQPAKFFIVTGKNEPPWEITEIDIWTGEAKEDQTMRFGQHDMFEVWEKIGLIEMRAQLRKWIRNKPSEIQVPQFDLFKNRPTVG